MREVPWAYGVRVAADGFFVKYVEGARALVRNNAIFWKLHPVVHQTAFTCRMCIVHPFRALRPIPQKVREVACVPYDVIDTEEARALAEGKPLSFLHVIRPEIDLPKGTDEHAPEVYEKGAENLRVFKAGDHTVLDDEPSLYVYRLVMNGRAQTGVFACVAVSDYDADRILKHEKTRPTKEEDRTKHILAQRAHAEPVMLTYRGSDAIDRVVAQTTSGESLYDFESEDGVRHTVWKLGDVERLSGLFAEVDHLYVADGHHRCKAASRAAEALRDTDDPGQAEYEFFPAVIFPMDEMQILAYNRIVRQLPVTPEAFLDALAAKFDVQPGSGTTVPPEPGVVCLYLGGQWHTMTLPETGGDTIADELDVARLSEFVLAPQLGITDPRRDPNIDFVGGIRGTDALERLVDSGEAELAISMYPTSVDELLAVSDAGLLMPPKSTWFEPKLRSGLLVHLFDEE